MMRTNTVQWIILVSWVIAIVIEILEARFEKRSYRYRWLAVAATNSLMNLAKVFENRLPAWVPAATILLTAAALAVWIAPGTARAWRRLRTSRTPTTT